MLYVGSISKKKVRNETSFEISLMMDGHKVITMGQDKTKYYAIVSTNKKPTIGRFKEYQSGIILPDHWHVS